MTTSSDWVDNKAQSYILVPPWWQRLLKRMARSFIGPRIKYQPKKNGNRKSARLNVACSWHLYTRSLVLMLSWEIGWTGSGAHPTVWSIWGRIANCMFLLLDKEPGVTPEWGTGIWMQEYCSHEGTKWPEANGYARSMMWMLTQLLDPIRTPFWIHIFMRWNFQREKWLIWQQTSLQSQWEWIPIIGSIHWLQKEWFSSQCGGPEGSHQRVRNSWLGDLLQMKRWIHIMDEVI